MYCIKCGSQNVTVQVVTNNQMKNAGHGCLWWLLIGWWWLPFKWIFLTLPALLFAIFGHKKQKIVSTHYTMCVCQSCGAHWRQ